MKKQILGILLLIAICTTLVSSNLPTHPGGFGFGLMLGKPSGICIEYWTKREYSLLFTLTYYIDKKVGIRGDYLYHFYNVVEAPELSFFVGGGFAMEMWEDPNVALQPVTQVSFGVRIPGGAEYTIAPFHFCLYLAPRMDLYPATVPDLEGGLQFTFYP